MLERGFKGGNGLTRASHLFVEMVRGKNVHTTVPHLLVERRAFHKHTLSRDTIIIKCADGSTV